MFDEFCIGKKSISFIGYKFMWSISLNDWLVLRYSELCIMQNQSGPRELSIVDNIPP